MTQLCVDAHGLLQGVVGGLFQSCCFQFLGMNTCSFEVGFQIVLVPLLWAALFTVARHQLTIEELAWDPSFIHPDHVASPA